MSDPTATYVEPIDRLRLLLTAGEPENLVVMLSSISASEAARAVGRLDYDEVEKLMRLLPREFTADLFEEMPEELVAQIAADHPRDAGPILDEMKSYAQADVLGEMDKDEAEEVLSHMSSQEAEEARELMAYEPDTAGGLMVTEYLSLPEHLTAQEVIELFRANYDEYEDLDVHYGYIVDEKEHFRGVLRLRDLLVAKPDTKVTELLIRDPRKLDVATSLDDLGQFFDRHTFFAVPILESSGELVGQVRRSHVKEALGKRDAESYRAQAGLPGGEEFRTMPVMDRAVRRFLWLALNTGMAAGAAVVVGAYETTIGMVTALAVMMPVLANVAGNAGAQAAAVTVRELALGLVRPTEVALVIRKEMSVGVLNGLALGTGLGVVTWFWKANLWLALLVASVFALEVLFAVAIGGVLPLLLRRMGHDPALASGPILLTVIDMSGFLMLLSFASFLLSRGLI
jgi:magnesium transporter